MKVLFITNIPSPYRVDFFNEFGKLVDLTVVYERHNASDREKDWKAAQAQNFKEIFLKGRTVRNDAAVCPSIVKYIKKKKYDAIIVGGYSTPTAMIAILSMKLRKIPFLLNADGGFIREGEKRRNIRIKRFFIRKASAWLSTGKMVDDYLVHYGARANKIYRYPFTSIWEKDILSGVLTKEEKEKFRKALQMKEEKIVITVGQMIHRKAPDILIKAAKKLPENVGVYIIGGNPTDTYAHLKKQLKADNVHFIGFKTKEQLSDYYKAADAFVLPTREDAWGLVINEAMGYGLPVITTKRCIAGVEMIQNGENGCIVPVENEEALAKGIQSVLENETVMLKMSEANLQKAREYTIEEMAAAHYKVLCEMYC